MGGWPDGEMGRWGDGDPPLTPPRRGRWGGGSPPLTPPGSYRILYYS
ncbi:hypothetical protein [Okeania sp. SIO1I7]|nr:hypothetical protein [Okeania sp. SIO1I7]NET27955.1 hypothetical protein [Okeania sp. SIO1I7]